MATHVFVPMAGAVLADWGADVVKVEHPDGGDPYRGLVTAGLHKTYGGVDIQFHAANRGKRSVGLDLSVPEGRSVLSRLLAEADVFLTNLRPAALDRLGITVEDVLTENPSIVYVRGSAFGPEGPDRNRGGYDAGAYWARSGMQQILRDPGAEYPAVPPAAFGDVVGGLTIAGAVGVALYRRSVTGVAPVVDSSLLASGMWQVQMDVINASVDRDRPGWRPADRYASWNPCMLSYRTADGRHIVLQMLAPDRHWPALCALLGHPEKTTDPRFVDIDARRANARECIEWLDGVFATRSLKEWVTALEGFEGEWVASQLPGEVAADAQVVANRYLYDVDLGTGRYLPTVTPPVRFDGERPTPGRAPEHGQHTEEVLLELGISWEHLAGLKGKGAVL